MRRSFVLVVSPRQNDPFRGECGEGARRRGAAGYSLCSIAILIIITLIIRRHHQRARISYSSWLTSCLSANSMMNFWCCHKGARTRSHVETNPLPHSQFAAEFLALPSIIAGARRLPVYMDEEGDEVGEYRSQNTSL